jgi:hypothetical protein
MKRPKPSGILIEQTLSKDPVTGDYTERILKEINGKLSDQFKSVYADPLTIQHQGIKRINRRQKLENICKNINNIMGQIDIMTCSVKEVVHFSKTFTGSARQENIRIMQTVLNGVIAGNIGEENIDKVNRIKDLVLNVSDSAGHIRNRITMINLKSKKTVPDILNVLSLQLDRDESNSLNPDHSPAELDASLDHACSSSENMCLEISSINQALNELKITHSRIQSILHDLAVFADGYS